MTIHEYIFVGIIVAMFSALIGVTIGKRGKVSEAECEGRQKACNTIICNELAHVKDDVSEMKKDIKTLLTRVN